MKTTVSSKSHNITRLSALSYQIMIIRVLSPCHTLHSALGKLGVTVEVVGTCSFYNSLIPENALILTNEN